MYDDYHIPASDELRRISDAFTNQLTNAEKGNTTSFPYIVHDISQSQCITDNEKFQIFVIGGSNGLSAICQKINERIIYTSEHTLFIPVFRDVETFCSFILTNLDAQITKLAINFAFPLSPVTYDHILTGILGRGTKEHAFNGMVGKNVADILSSYIFAKTGRKIIITIANDTVCLLLARGREGRKHHSVAAAVIGTGINTAIYSDSDHIVNLESANFNGFSQSSVGKRIDTDSLEKGVALFEKEISGAYLYKHVNILCKARGAGMKDNLTSTRQVSELASDLSDTRSTVCRQVLARSASLAACMFSGIADYYHSDTTFVVEGSLFWEAYGYKDTIMDSLHSLTSYSVDFVHIPDSSIVGAAFLLVS